MARKTYYYEPDYTGIVALLLIYLFFKLWKYRYIFLFIGILFVVYIVVRKIVDLDLKSNFKKPIFYYKGNSGYKRLNELKQKGEKEKVKALSSGLYGESRLLYNLEKSDIPIYILYDLNLKIENLKSQIDVIIISKRNIYVLESKNLRGTLKIDELGNFVRKVKYNNFGMKNPITQNTEHINTLKSILKQEKIRAKVKSLVVLTNDDGYINYKKNSKEYAKFVVRNDQLINTIKNIEKSSHIVRSQNKIEKICDCILKYNEEYNQEFKEEIEIIELDIDINNLELELRKWRRERALKENILPYAIFNDDTLKDIVESKPKTLNDLIKIKGLGEKRILKYGSDILSLVKSDDLTINI